MSAELEGRLERALDRLPHAGPDIESRARAAALAALPPAERRADRSHRVLVVAAAALALLVAVTAGLAATGTVTIGRRDRTPAVSPPPRLRLPPHADGVALLVDGRLWLATRGGTRIEGLRASSAALSPHALYVALGIGRSLVAMAPNGRTAWAHRTAGEVVAIAWAPDGLRIAYVVHTGHGFALRTIEGDGDHDRLLDATVRPVRPTWRPDSLALAYVGGGGRAVLYDLGHESRRTLRSRTLPWTATPELRTVRTRAATEVVSGHGGRATNVFRAGPRARIVPVDLR